MTRNPSSRRYQYPSIRSNQGRSPFSLGTLTMSSSGGTPSGYPYLKAAPSHDVDEKLQEDKKSVCGDDEETAELLQSWQEEAHWMSFRCAIQEFVSSEEKHPSNRDDEEEDMIQDALADLPISELQQRNTPSPTGSSSSHKSTLAETQMRLALAQAERDELEFELMQHKQA